MFCLLQQNKDSLLLILHGLPDYSSLKYMLLTLTREICGLQL